MKSVKEKRSTKKHKDQRAEYIEWSTRESASKEIYKGT
jgi:hypothetical protein